MTPNSDRDGMVVLQTDPIYLKDAMKRFSPELANLQRGLFAIEEEQRFTISKVLQHEWIRMYNSNG